MKRKFLIVLFHSFKIKAKVVISTGFPYGKGQNTEVIDLTNPSLKFELRIIEDNNHDLEENCKFFEWRMSKTIC